MIIFEFDTEIVEGCDRILYWVGNMHVEGSDAEHENEIYEQLDAEVSGLTNLV